MKPTQPACCVGQGVVASEPHQQHCGLVDEVRIEVLIAEPGGGCVQRGVGQVDVRHVHHRLQVESRDGLSDGDEVCEVEVLDVHLARHSRSSRSSSMIWRTADRHAHSVRSRSPRIVSKCLRFLVTSPSPCSSAVAAMRASGSRIPNSRATRPARSAIARSTASSRNGASNWLDRFVAVLPAKSSARVTTE